MLRNDCDVEIAVTRLLDSDVWTVCMCAFLLVF